MTEVFFRVKTPYKGQKLCLRYLMMHNFLANVLKKKMLYLNFALFKIDFDIKKNIIKIIRRDYEQTKYGT